MPFFDVYLLLMGGALAFGAAMSLVSGAPTSVVGALLAVAVLTLVAGAVSVLRTERYIPKVLLVGERRRNHQLQVREALRAQGFDLRSCVGPAARECPVFRGEPCPVHAHPVAALVFEPALGSVPAAPCGEALHIPVLTVERGSDTPPVVSRGTGHVGLDLGASVVAGAVRALVAAESA